MTAALSFDGFASLAGPSSGIPSFSSIAEITSSFFCAWMMGRERDGDVALPNVAVVVEKAAAKDARREESSVANIVTQNRICDSNSTILLQSASISTLSAVLIEFVESKEAGLREIRRMRGWNGRHDDNW